MPAGNAGEFLNLSHNFFERAVQIDDTGSFAEDIRFLPCAHGTMSQSQAIDFCAEEYFSRVEILERYSRPLVFKAHVPSLFFSLNPELLDDAISRFTPLFLVRRDGMKSILSEYICEELGFWHTSRIYEDTADRISNVRLKPYEEDFLARIDCYNTLVKLFNSADDANRIVFEDFASDPIPKLTARFNLQGQIKPIEMKKFIGRHDIHFTNLAELRKIYDEHALKI
jgi:hypothetical protein